MKNLIYFLLVCCLLTTKLDAQVEPKREMRATWMASVANIDWPKYEHRGKPELQKQELIRMLDLYQTIHLNAIFLQVRPECDALYNSSYEPWSRYLSWTQGTDPGYDPLQFAIEEAHKRGIEVHAWMNPYRINASTSDGGDYYAPGHVYLEHPEWALEYPDGKKILNPGIPEVMSYLGKIVEDVAANYNVDGIHFDDYFYAYGGTDPSLDSEEYNMYGGGLSLGDWRRQNINRMIDTVYTAIQKTNPNIRFGVSPFGIYKNGVPQGIIGLDSYSQIYCDPLAWLDAGSVDYLTPQQYWPTGGAQDFETLTGWWSNECYQRGRHHYPGQGTYRLSDKPDTKKASQIDQDLHEMKKYFDMNSTKKSSSENLSRLEQNLLKSTSDPVADWTLGQIGLQIDIIRSHRDQNSLGSVFFSAKDFDRVAGLADYISRNKYTHPALIPEMTWKGGDTPQAPTNLRTVEIENNYYISWDFPAGSNDRFAIYTTTEITDPATVIQNPVNLKEISFNNQFALEDLDFSNGSNIVITAVSPTGKESTPSPLFELDINLPLVQASLPFDGDTVAISDILSWQTDATGANFNVEVSANTLFSNLIYDSPWIADTSVDIENMALEGETEYFWRVQARTDLEGPYSETRSIFTGFPEKPAIVSPVNLAQSVSTQPLIKWSASPGTDSVKVLISENTGFDAIHVEEIFEAAQGQERLAAELDKDTWYYLKIQGLNEYGPSNLTEFITFKTTSGEIPDVMIIAPEEGANVASFDHFEWETTATTGNITYLLEVALDQEFNSIMSASGWITEQSIQVSKMNLEGNRNYYWRVKGKSEFGESEYTNPRNIYAGYPTRPGITSPAQLSENNDVRAIIEWTAGASADSILVEFSQEADFETVEYAEKFHVSESPAQINHSLREFTWYFARIKAENEYGYSIYSANKYFMTGESNAIEITNTISEPALYPNPFNNGALVLEFKLYETTGIDISIFDITGQMIMNVEKGRYFPAGLHRISLKEYTEKMSSGYYYLKIRAGKDTRTIKMIKLDN